MAISDESTIWPKPETGWMNPESGTPKPNSLPVHLHDLRIRLIMIPAFGIAIPHLTGYFGDLGPADLRYWAGHLWGVAIAFTIWHGNRFFLLKQREHFDWFQHAFRKLTLLAFACIFYTVPVTVAMMLAWYRFAQFGPDWEVIRVVALACVVCVAFITHVYETVYLIQQRESDLVAVERLERARTQAELDALRAQVAPHFLFNSLNTLSSLIESNSARALEFNQNLAEVYRYILVARRSDLVRLDDELTFLSQYIELLKLRFEDSLEFEVAPPGERAANWYLPPLSLQVLVENAVKHNEHSIASPLRTHVRFDEGSVVVSNRRRPRSGEPSPGLGLKTLDERCRLVLGRGIELETDDESFAVRVPVRAL